MNDDRLRTLIEKADAGTAPPGMSADQLSSRARVLYRRRYNRQLAATAIAMLFVCGIGSWRLYWLLPGSDKKEVVRSPSALATDIAAAENKLAELKEQIKQHEQIVGQLLAAEQYHRQKAEADRWLSKSAGQEYLDQQIGQAAATILLSADQEKHNPAFMESARKSYNLVIELFPQTTWADQAKERLAAIEGIRD